MKEKVRIDKYLWAIRIFKTRTLAAAACDHGKVKLKGESVKASKGVVLGEEYEVKKENEKMIIKVVGIIEKRVGYEEAIKNYINLTPDTGEKPEKALASSFYTGKRLSKVGRPTKQKRRNLDDFMDNFE